MIRKGEPWGKATGGPPDIEVAGGDTDLARVAAEHPGALINFRPADDSDLARAVGLTHSQSAGSSVNTTEITLDGLRIDAPGTDVTPAFAVNMAVFGVAPDRVRWWHRMRTVTVHVDGRAVHAGPATTVVVANGQHLRRHDLVPRGHPGDGRAEVQVYAVRRAERAEMRRRSGKGEHLPHPQIVTSAGKSIEVAWATPVPAELDGRPGQRVTEVTINVVAAAYRLLV